MDDPLLQSPSRVLFFSSSAVCRCMSSALAGYGMILLISRKKLSLRFFGREKPWKYVVCSNVAGRKIHENMCVRWFFICSKQTKPPFVWVNYNISLTWIVRPWLGMIPRILTMISSEGEQWGRYVIYPGLFTERVILVCGWHLELVHATCSAKQLINGRKKKISKRWKIW